MNAWESIFLQSPVNKGCYDEDDLPAKLGMAQRDLVSISFGLRS